MIQKNFKEQDIRNVRNKFNNEYSQVVPKLKQQYKRNKFNLPKDNNSDSYVRESIYIQEITNEKTEEIINELKNTGATGNDGIMIKHIKMSSKNSAIIITKIINKIIEEEKWPKEMKIQTLRPIYKNGNKKEVLNYRPISILPVIDKIAEKYMSTIIQKFFQKHNIINDKQFGFQEGKGTNEALEFVKEKINKAMDEGQITATIFIDLQKAFDTLDHKLLLKKLQN